LEKKLRRYVGENLILDDTIIFLFIIIGKNIRKPLYTGSKMINKNYNICIEIFNKMSISKRNVSRDEYVFTKKHQTMILVL